MKFPSIAISLMVGLAAVDATKTKQSATSVTEKIQARFQSGQFNKELLYKNAIPASQLKNGGRHGPPSRRKKRRNLDADEDEQGDADADGEDQQGNDEDEAQDQGDNQDQYNYENVWNWGQENNQYGGDAWNGYDFDGDYFAANFDYDTAYFPISGAYSAAFQSCHAISMGYNEDNYNGNNNDNGNNNGNNGNGANYLQNDGYWDGF